jgi:hypothetical protein
MWIGLWFVTSTLAGILVSIDQQQRLHEARLAGNDRHSTEFLASELDVAKTDWRPLVSYTTNLSRIGKELLGTDACWERILQSRPINQKAVLLYSTSRDSLYPWYWSAAVLAVLFGLSACILNFSIKSLIAIAPSDEFYKPAGNPVTVENVNYFVLHGGHDGDVAIFMGSRQYQRVKFSGDDYHFKSVLWIYRANHGQFNTTWGDNDWGGPLGRMLNFKPLLDENDQRRIAKVYISGFLEATLHAQPGYVPMFRDHRVAAAWLPETIYLNRFRDARFKLVSDYEEDLDVATTTVPGGTEDGENLKVWKEEKLPLRSKGGSNQENSVVRLGWEKAEDGSRASYRITLPGSLAEQWRLDGETSLSFSLANAGKQQEPIEIAIELGLADGTTVSLPLKQFATINPPLTIQFSKMKWLESTLLDSSELVPQTYELPLTAFVKANSKVDPAKIKTITLLIDRTSDGAIVLDDVGFSTKEGPVSGPKVEVAGTERTTL